MSMPLLPEGPSEGNRRGRDGQQGGAVARALLAKGRTVRSFVRNPLSDSARQLAAEGMTLAIADLSDRASIDRAIVGVSVVFSVQTSSPSGLFTDEEEVAQRVEVAKSAHAAGVAHIVYLSGGAAEKDPTGIGHFDSKSRIADHLPSLRQSAFRELFEFLQLGADVFRSFHVVPHSCHLTCRVPLVGSMTEHLSSATRLSEL